MDPMKEEIESFKGGRGGGGHGSESLGTSILGNSGLMVHAGGITQCSSTDQTWFCWLSRLVGMIQYVLFILVIIFVLYYFVWPMISKNLGFSGSRRGKGRG